MRYLADKSVVDLLSQLKRIRFFGDSKLEFLSYFSIVERRAFFILRFEIGRTWNTREFQVKFVHSTTDPIQLNFSLASSSDSYQSSANANWKELFNFFPEKSGLQEYDRLQRKLLKC